MQLDIQYLLFLQELRNATGGVFDEFFNALSKIAVDVMPLLPFILFWCTDKKWGYRFLASYSGAELLNGILKLTVCAYRPWIRSDLIEPAGDSKVAATGYSFPSGHTTVATVMYGGTAAWQYVRRRWLSVICIILLALTGFSRNFLGVHTPQDVAVGFGATSILMVVIWKVHDKVENDDKMIDKLSVAGIVLVAAVLVYIQVKPYPMDYVDGQLLVDPQKMMNDTFKSCGMFLGFIVGSYVERHYVNYKIPEGAKNLPIMACVGAGIVLSWKEYLGSAVFVGAFGGHWGNFIARFLMLFFAVAVYPVVINKFCCGGNGVEAQKKMKA
ncbi:MAG: phosphatase PAP2 family protein [Lachnospiraceae bacterium]|nr:phosphatase PAP2 family protein [Lachnospiraceae bacterium]